MTSVDWRAVWLGAVLAAQAAPVERFYVARDGDDRWSGRLAKPNEERTDGPFATLERAREVVRERKGAGLTAPVEVLVGDGTWTLAEPLVFTPEDSGTAECPITWRAADGAAPVLSGGRELAGFQRGDDGVWSAPVPDGLRFRLLRVGERWAIRARHPNFDPDAPLTGGWTFAEYGGLPWERGSFGSGVQNTHNVGDRLTWTVDVPAAGTYAVWLRYAHNMARYGTDDMAGRTSLAVDDGDAVPLVDLPDTGGWNAFRWSRCAELTLTAGEHRIAWRNNVGGGINLDAYVLCDDPDWNPEQAIGNFTWWGAFTVQPPAEGRHYLLVQCEACDSAEGPEIRVPQPVPPGTTKHMVFRPDALPPIADPSEAEVHIFIAWGWVNAIVPIGAIDQDRRRIVFAGDGAAQDVRVGNRFFVENARELLDAPGEWFLDTAANRVFYIPDHPSFPNQPVVAPLLDRLLVLQGDADADRWVEHLTFEGFRFIDTTYNLTRDYYTPSDAAIHLSAARHCAIRRCEFSWLGGYAVQLNQRSHEVEVSRCHIHDMGQGGVHLVGGTAVQPHHCTVLANTIERIGLIYKHVAGVYVTHGSDNRIAHNRITDTPRYAISLKSQGEERLSHRNIVEYNDIRRVNLETNDTGAFESLGYEHRDSGNIVRFNRILDSVGMATTPDGRILTPYFTWGVYLDDYSSGTTVYGNIIARTHNGGICVHGGAGNQIENNIFVDGYEEQIRLQPRDDYMRRNTFQRNIVCYSRPEARLVSSWNPRTDLFDVWDHNLYWLRAADLTALETPITPQGPWAKWLAAGFDEHSQVADPLFVDPDHDDYRLRPESPALALGFEPIPVEKIGPEGAE